MSPGPETPLPRSLLSNPDEVFAVYHVFRAIGEFAGGEVGSVRSADSTSVVGLALRQQGRTRLLVANLTHAPRTVRIHGVRQGEASVFRLDSDNVESANRDPETFAHRAGQRISVTEQDLELRLPAHGIARIDQSPEN